MYKYIFKKEIFLDKFCRLGKVLTDKGETAALFIIFLMQFNFLLKKKLNYYSVQGVMSYDQYTKQTDVETEITTLYI